MATVTQAQPASGSGLEPYRLSVRQVERMIGEGILAAGDRVELLGGVLVRQMTKNPPHDYAIGRLAKLLDSLVAPDWIVREEKSVVLGRIWRPEPDIAVARGPLERYRRVQPVAKDLAILIEVSESTYAADRGEKYRGYATAKVPVYWIVDLERRRVEVFNGPTGRGDSARYRTVSVHGPGDSVPVVIDGRELAPIAVNEFLP